MNLSPDRNLLLVGERDDLASERIGQLRAALEAALIGSPPVARIRETIWSKLLTNMSMSVLCLLTGQTARAVRDDPALREIVPRLLDEAQAIGRSCYPAVTRATRTGAARAQAVAAAGLRTRPGDGDRCAGTGAGGVCPGRRIVDADARPCGGLAIQKARDKGLYPA